ncbi:MAG TPA: DUF4292 domain-containing protein [Cytophagaceae bacterium]|jgi:hypothetical protein|nr:DUF4292 domain-containing protein [Cytophagaceae bacterium]
MNRLIPVFSLFFIFLSACKKQPASSTHEHSLKSDTAMDWKPLGFDYLVIKSKISFKTKDNVTNLTANIRIKKDSIIWLSVTPGMGIEVLRAVITPDSVKLINRIDNKYDQYSISYIRETLGIGLDYYNLQNLLVGDVLLPLSDDDLVTTSGVNWQIDQKRQTMEAVSMISKLQKKVTATEVKSNDGKYLLVGYKEFILTDSVLFHEQQSLLVKNGNDTSFLEASHQKVEFPKKSVAFPFNVPKKYEK